ncbi:hypothetical protein [Caldimonas sp. KR1-144]|uniref:hypothetical protein n=1 Tax=Caldimonas sp. KR1-144 TaxID=3400911 RepID=UPI003BFE1191
MPAPAVPAARGVPQPTRRRLLQLGAGAAVALALAGTGAALWSPGWREGRLSPTARALFASVGGVVLEGSLPADPVDRERALSGMVERLEAALAGLPHATRAQLSQLLGLLQIGPARRWLCGLDKPWTDAAPHDVERALVRMRTADDALRQQVYQALRSLVSASYFSAPETWAQLGYLGPVAL